MSFDKEKFTALILYVIWKAGDSPGFGATKLNKVLWFSDARSYMLHGKPITGATYIREKFGPVPREFMPIKNEMTHNRQIEAWTDQYYSRPITKFRVLEQPQTGSFTEEERQIVDWWLTHIDEEHTADSISEQSHDYAWEIAEMGEVIPLYAIFANRIRAPKGKELEWAKAEAERLGLP